MTSTDQVKAILGTPYFEHGSTLLYQGDCVDFLSRLSGIDAALTVTSPPYNIGKTYESVRPLDDYLAWCEKWMTLIHGVTSPTGSFWLNVGYVAVADKGKNVPLPYLLWDRSPFYMLQEIVWNYGAGVASRRAFSPRNEKFVWYVKDSEKYYFDLDSVRDPDVKYPNQKKNGKLKCNPLGKNPTDVWQFAKVTSGKDRSSKERTPHPAQFPMAVIERIVKSCSEPNDLLIDPFLGSGTTCVVAQAAGRASVGFEIREDYLELAAKRIASVDDNPSLF